MELNTKSIIEVAGIAEDAAQECFISTRLWLGEKIAQLDEWLCDYGD